MIQSLAALFSLPDLRKKLFWTLGLIIVFRLGVHIPVPGVDNAAILSRFGAEGLLGFLDLFTGGALVRFSIFALGIIPYINASIILQLLQVVIPQLEEMRKEDEDGRKKLAQYTRYLTVFLAAFQSVGMAFFFRSFLLPEYSFTLFLVSTVVTLTAGAMLVMWLGEVITDRGIGNGASLLIFIGIVARIPAYVSRTVQLVQGGASLFGVLVVLAVFAAMIIGIVIIQEGQRRVPVQYAKRVVGRKVYGGQSTYIPLRINQGGVLPIIFASSVLLFPATMAQFVPIGFLQGFAHWFSPSSPPYMVAFFLMILFFTYFYTALTFNPNEVADNIKKYGGFISGIRPGKPTADYLEFVITRITLVGAIFLACIAVVPVVVESATRITSFQGLGGTALLIVVGVGLDLVRQIEAQLLTRQYERLLA